MLVSVLQYKYSIYTSYNVYKYIVQKKKAEVSVVVSD